MKLRFVLFVLLGIFAITLSIHDVHAQTEEEDDRNRDYLSYENDEIGVTLEYPANWKLVEGIPDVPFVARFWAPGATGLISMDHVYRDTKISPENIAESNVRMLETKGRDLKIIESKPLVISNHPAWQLTYSTADNAGHRLIESEVHITTDNSRYVFSYSVWDGFPDYLPVFNSIIDSVQIKPIDMENSPNAPSETFSSVYVPDWVEHNVRWWNGGQINDQTMISMIQFLADREIIIMPSMKEIDVYKIAQGDAPEIHEHIQQNAWRWAESDLRPENFLKGIGYLASLNSQDESPANSKNPDDCPQSFSSRCFAGKVTEIIDGDTIQVGDITVHLALVSPPKLDEDGGQDVRGVVQRICSIGTPVLIDQDNVHQSDGFASGAPVLAVVYCNGLNINEILLHRELGTFDSTYCHDSEFADESWAREGCSQ